VETEPNHTIRQNKKVPSL